jgi:hypothetical protein
MTRIIFVTVSDDRFKRKDGQYEQYQNNIRQFLESHTFLGITDYYFLKWNDIITTPFYEDHKDMLDDPDPSMNGRCYKPYAIVEALKQINEGDYLIYNDVSPEMWNPYLNIEITPEVYDIDIIKQLCRNNNGILTAAVISQADDDALYGIHTHEHYTLEGCIKRMGLEEFKYSLQHASGMIMLQKSQKTVEFANEWLRYNVIDECASLEAIPRSKGIYFWNDESSLYGKLGHRHDQSISGLLINKLGNKLVIPIHSKYNFLNFCMKHTAYQFIDSNYNYKTPSKYVYKTIFDGINWVPTKLLRSG